jgi:resuscitation-promoting factor RpfA
MTSRPATLASKGRNLLRSAIAEVVASDPAQRAVAPIGAPGRPSRTTIWVSLGAVAALSTAVIIGTVLRTGTPGGLTPATSAPETVAAPSTQAPATAPATVPSAPVAPTATTGTPVSTWDKVAQCESGGNWATSTGNGFHGGLQFTASTWRSFGGSGVPHEASRTEQIAVAERVLAAQGWKAWPACSRKLGLR